MTSVLPEHQKLPLNYSMVSLTIYREDTKKAYKTDKRRCCDDQRCFPLGDMLLSSI